MNGTKHAYSALPSLLLKQRLTVAELYRRLEARGKRFDRKSVYRLAGSEPLQTLNMALVGAVCEELGVALQQLISLGPPPAKLARIDTAVQDRLDELMSRNTEGKLTAKERRELEVLVDEVERLSLENARMLSRQTRTAKPARKSLAGRRKLTA